MKKVKILALVLTAALMLTGVGYALWSESIVLKSTASTGFMDVNFVGAERNTYNQGIIDGRAYAEVNELTQMGGEYYLTHDPDDANTDGGQDWNDAYFITDEANDTIKFSVRNLYPQAVHEFIFKVRNDGTVPVKLKSYSITSDDEADENEIALFRQLKNNIKIAPEDIHLAADGEETEIYVTFAVPDWSGDRFEKKSCNFSIQFNWEQEDVTNLAG